MINLKWSKDESLRDGYSLRATISKGRQTTYIDVGCAYKFGQHYYSGKFDNENYETVGRYKTIEHAKKKVEDSFSVTALRSKLKKLVENLNKGH